MLTTGGCLPDECLGHGNILECIVLGFVEGFGGGVVSHARACDLFSPEPRVHGEPLFVMMREE